MISISFEENILVNAHTCATLQKKNREIRVTLPSAAVFDTLFENHKKVAFNLASF